MTDELRAMVDGMTDNTRNEMTDETAGAETLDHRQRKQQAQGDAVPGMTDGQVFWSPPTGTPAGREEPTLADSSRLRPRLPIVRDHRLLAWICAVIVASFAVCVGFWVWDGVLAADGVATWRRSTMSSFAKVASAYALLDFIGLVATVVSLWRPKPRGSRVRWSFFSAGVAITRTLVVILEVMTIFSEFSAAMLGSGGVPSPMRGPLALLMYLVVPVAVVVLGILPFMAVLVLNMAEGDMGTRRALVISAELLGVVALSVLLAVVVFMGASIMTYAT